MRVFISHSSKDKPAVEPLVLALRERSFDPWFDKWEISPGDDIVASINAGLDEAGAGIIAFSRALTGKPLGRGRGQLSHLCPDPGRENSDTGDGE
jgi:hypothetical protein